MDGSLWTTTKDSRNTLLERRDRVHERICRVRGRLRRQGEPLPRDDSDAAIIIENNRILQNIEDSACRELADIDRALSQQG
jgi:hypothetical protein